MRDWSGAASGVPGHERERIIRARYRDVPWGEARCPHFTPLISEEVSNSSWNAHRGKAVSIIANGFEAGACSGCDGWPIADDSPHWAFRAQLEIGD